MRQSPKFSIIIPVYNGGSAFLRCLQSVHQSTFDNWELVVVDDGSTDGSDRLARQFDARVLFTGGGLGPAAARNLGGRQARGIYLFFLDADCTLHPDTLENAAAIFDSEPGLDALFGSYDDEPAAKNFVAQYKNLFHHYVHQHGQEDASTFWTGCGAIERGRFLALGGFDLRRYRRPAIEDIDLGYRLKKAGGRIRLAKHVEVKHLKAWTLPGLLKTDIFDRGIPWTRLILREKIFARDLNLQTQNRVSVVAVYGLLLALLAAFWEPLGLLIAAGLAMLLLWLNLPLYSFFYRKRGLWFALSTVPLHWLYYFYNGISFGIGWILHLHHHLRSGGAAATEPLVDGVEPDGT
jgi:glycosyltransferase involved in cell wall biosynthesis